MRILFILLLVFQFNSLKADEINYDIIKEFESFQEVIMGIRNLRKENNIANKVVLDLSVKINTKWSNTFDSLLSKMGNLKDFNFTNESLTGAFSFVVKNNEFFIPFNEFIDTKQEINKLKAEIEDGSWHILKKINDNDVLEDKPNLWKLKIEELGEYFKIWSNSPENPNLN